MNITKTVLNIAKNHPKQFNILVEQINDVAADFGFERVRTINEVIFFCSNCEIGEELLHE